MVRNFAPTIQESPRAGENPCVRNCCLDENNVCMGCGRRLAEILEWHHADADRRSTIRLSAQSRLMQRQMA